MNCKTATKRQQIYLMNYTSCFGSFNLYFVFKVTKMLYWKNLVVFESKLLEKTKGLATTHCYINYHNENQIEVYILFLQTCIYAGGAPIMLQCPPFHLSCLFPSSKEIFHLNFGYLDISILPSSYQFWIFGYSLISHKSHY